MPSRLGKLCPFILLIVCSCLLLVSYISFFLFWLFQVLYLQRNGDIMEMVDPRLGSEFNKKEVVRMINVALLCTNQSPAHRPTMSTVVSMLEGKTDVEELVMVRSTLDDPSGYAQSSVNGSLSETQSLVKSSEGPCVTT